MALYDLINDVQIHCFKNNLSKFKTGEKIYLSYYNYEENSMFLETVSPPSKIYKRRMHIIRDSIIEKTIEVSDIEEDDFDNINAVYSDTGKALNINNRNDLIDFLHDICKLEIDKDFLSFKNYNNNNLKDEYTLEDEFFDKWYKK